MRDNKKGGALTEVSFLILLALRKPRHGYAVMQWIEEKTAGRLILGAGTLYGALIALEEKGLIEACDEGDGRKKEFIVTAQGKEICKKEIERLRHLTDLAANVLEN